MRVKTIENNAFLILVVLTTLTFLWLIRGFMQPLLWAVVLAITFRPLHERWLRVLGSRPAWAAASTLVSIVLLVIVPLLLVGSAVVQEASAVYGRIVSGEIDVRAPLGWLWDAMPRASEHLERLGVDANRLQQGLSSTALTVSRFLASRALVIGQDAVRVTAMLFLMLYVLFFLLRDGPRIVDVLVHRLPFGDARERELFARFAVVTRATIKGTLVIGMVQGALGGLLFWVLGISAPVLWGVIMTILSILPVVGASLVWFPAAVSFFLSGDWVRGGALVIVGVLVIGLIDNLLRPILVGRDTQLPDYMILVSTMGGLSLFGLAGFVIGPLIAALFVTVWEMFAMELHADAEATGVALATEASPAPVPEEPTTAD